MGKSKKNMEKKWKTVEKSRFFLQKHSSFCIIMTMCFFEKENVFIQGGFIK